MPLVAFISYQSRDLASAERLRDELTLRGILAVFDRRTFLWGNRVAAEMESGVETCDAFVAPVTENYLYENEPGGAARPALDQEFIPAMQRRRSALGRANQRGEPVSSVRPVVIPVIRGLGDRTEAATRIRQATGEDVMGLWLPCVDQEAEDLPQADAARVAAQVLRTLLPANSSLNNGVSEVCIVTRGTGQPTADITIDATKLLGGHVARPGDPCDWNRYLRGLRDVQATLALNSRVRDLHVSLNAHMTAAIAFGRVFHQATGWRFSIAGRHDEATTGPASSELVLEESWEDADLTSDWLLIEIEIVDQPVRALAGSITRRAESTQRGRLQMVNTHKKDLSSREISALAIAAASSIRRVVGEHRPRQIHLVCAAPVEFSALLGHRLTSLHADIHLYERNDDEYVPSLVLPADL